MATVSLKEARKRLGELVRSAELGESITLTRRGKVVARLEPPAPQEVRKLPDLSDFRASVTVKGKALSKIVIEGRERERY